MSQPHRLSLVAKDGRLEVGDAELAQRLIAKDPSVATEVWRRFAPLIHGLLRRSLGHEPETEDLTQEVFARLCAKIDTLQNHAALRSFVFSIAVRVLREELRRRKLRQWLGLSKTGVLPEVQGAPFDPEGREAVRHFYSVLDELGALERTVFVLKYVEGSSLSEIGSALGLSLATVKRRLARASDRVDLLMRQDSVLANYPSRRQAGES